MTAADDLAPWRARWGLIEDGAAFVTSYTQSRLQPVLTADGRPAMLKLAVAAEETRGNSVMAWWDGQGAAQVWAHDGGALLLERLDGPRSLFAMSKGGEDDRATELLCETALKLHRDADGAPSSPSLRRWFAALEREAGEPGEDQPTFAAAWATAQALLERDAPAVLLHGDLHHLNVLDSPRGWLAIDPKGVVGDAGYDFANILNNPDPEVSHGPGRLRRQAQVIAGCTGRPLEDVLRWGLAYAALSASWSKGDGHDEYVRLALTTARIAQAELAAIA